MIVLLNRGYNIYGGTPLGPAAKGGSSARGCAAPSPNPNGLWQPIRVRGRRWLGVGSSRRLGLRLPKP
jgi:hypothetical protein